MSDDRATTWLITGAAGAGKTTYARRLAGEAGVLRFSADEWIPTLFGADEPDAADPAWRRERVERCTAVIQGLVLQAAAIGEAKLGRGAVLDLGMETRAERERMYAWARGAGLVTSLVYIDVPAATRWERLAARPAGRGEPATDRVSFDQRSARFEPPDEHELAAHRGRRIRA
jgi:predicted kinase